MAFAPMAYVLVVNKGRDRLNSRTNSPLRKLSYVENLRSNLPDQDAGGVLSLL